MPIFGAEDASVGEVGTDPDRVDVDSSEVAVVKRGRGEGLLPGTGPSGAIAERR